MIHNVMMVSVIGPGDCPDHSAIYNFTVELGEALLDNNFTVVCGGLGGVMEAVCKGAHQSKSYYFGCTVGILPGRIKSDANRYVDHIIPTGMGVARNLIVVNSGDVVIAVGGGSGTLSELAFAWQLGKKIICVKGFGGWSEKLAATRIDDRRSDIIYSAQTVSEIIKLISCD